MCEDYNLEVTKKEKREIEYYEAKIIYLPEKWNSYCYVIESKIHDKDSVTYLSENSLGKPNNKNINDVGFLYKKYLNDSESSYIFCWADENKFLLIDNE